MARLPSWAFAALLLGLAATRAAGFHFYLFDGKQECFQHFAKGVVHASYLADFVGVKEERPPNAAVTLVVTDPHGKTLPAQTKMLEFAGEPMSMDLEVPDAMEFIKVCVGAKGVKEYKVRFEIDVDPEPADIYHRPAGEEGLAYAHGIRAMRFTMDNFATEMDYQMTRLGEFSDTTDSTHTRVLFWTVVNFVIGVGSCVWQVLALKKMFKDKKVV